jgi:hypothetical protein
MELVASSVLQVAVEALVVLFIAELEQYWDA